MKLVRYESADHVATITMDRASSHNALNPALCEELCEAWRGHCERHDTNEEVLHYMRNQRKQGFWVTFDGDHVVAPSLPELTAEETEILITIYSDTVAAAGEGSLRRRGAGKRAATRGAGPAVARCVDAGHKVHPPHPEP